MDCSPCSPSGTESSAPPGRPGRRHGLGAGASAAPVFGSRAAARGTAPTLALLLVVCIENVAPFCPPPLSCTSPSSAAPASINCGSCAALVSAPLAFDRSRLCCAGLRPILGRGRRAGITALESSGVPDSSTITLQRLYQKLLEEGASIEAREDARSGGRKRRLFRPRPAAPAIPQYGEVSVLEPTRKHTATIIWLHDAPPGAASSPQRWKRRLGRMDLGWCRILIPAGLHVERERTLLEMVRRRDPRHWYAEGSDRGLAASLQYVQTLVAREVESGVAPDRIMIGGVGQGADIAVLTGLLLNARLGGVLSLAAHLPESIAFVPSPESAATPFLCWVPPYDDDAAEAADTLLSLDGAPRRVECAPDKGNWLVEYVDAVRRRWRVWGSACRAQVEDFIWRTIPEDLHSIPAVDLVPVERRRGSSGGRPERFAPLEELKQQRRIDSMTLRELQVCMQFHRVPYDDVSSEAEARFRLRSAAMMYAQEMRRPGSGSAPRTGGEWRGRAEPGAREDFAEDVLRAGQEALDLGRAAFTSEEARREIFERAWGAGRDAASFAQRAASDDEARKQAMESLRGTAENAAYYAQETFSDPSAAQDMARAAWEAGRAAASSFGQVASEFVEDYSKPGGGAGRAAGAGERGWAGGQQSEVNVSKILSADEWYNRYV
jgi:predicted esterase